jgi:hypothetical protein
MVLILLLLANLAKRVNRAGGSSPTQGEDETPEESDLLESLREKTDGRAHDTLAAELHYEEAIHALLLSALTGILSTQPELDTPSLTSRKILADVVLDEEPRRELEILIQAVELCIFAKREASASMYERCVRAHAEVSRAVDAYVPGADGEVEA